MSSIWFSPSQPGAQYLPVVCRVFTVQMSSSPLVELDSFQVASFLLPDSSHIFPATSRLPDSSRAFPASYCLLPASSRILSASFCIRISICIDILLTSTPCILRHTPCVLRHTPCVLPHTPCILKRTTPCIFTDAITSGHSWQTPQRSVPAGRWDEYWPWSQQLQGVNCQP